MVMIPVGEFVRIGVTIIQEASLLTHQGSSLHIGFTLVDTNGPLAKEGLVYSYSLSDVLGLLLRAHILIVNPAVSIVEYIYDY